MRALKRLLYEQEKFKQNTYEAIEAGPIDEANMYNWRASIEGPIGSPYESGVFDLLIDYSTEYPFKAPKMRFETKIFHPNVSRKGSICVDILEKQWSPAITTSTLLLSIRSLLASPNPYDPMDQESAEMYLKNKEHYFQRASQYTQRYAAGKKGL